MRRLFKPLRYVFFRVLSWKLRDAQEPTPILVASLVTFLLLFFNVMGLTMVINIATGRRPVLMDFPGGRVGLSVAVLCCAIAAYRTMTYAWVQGGKYEALIREFDREPTQDRVRLALFWSYVVASIALPIVLAVLWSKA